MGLYMVQVVNPRVVRELTQHPDGERAQKVMLLTLPEWPPHSGQLPARGPILLESSPSLFL